jgi:hypothetical protein
MGEEDCPFAGAGRRLAAYGHVHNRATGFTLRQAKSIFPFRDNADVMNPSQFTACRQKATVTIGARRNRGDFERLLPGIRCF